MELKHRRHIDNFEDVLVENTNFKKVYTLLLRWKIIPVNLEAFKDISKVRSDKENNKILYRVIKSRGEHAFSKLKHALQLSNPELYDQFLGHTWKLSNEQWRCLPQVYDLSNAEIRGVYRIVTFTENRLGWEKEVKNLQETFQYLGYEGSVCNDPGEKDPNELLSNFTSSERDAGCYVFALSGHGHGSHGEEYILQRNKSYKKVNEILSEICTAPALLGKPKIIILQICRGELEAVDRLGSSNTSFSTPIEIPGIEDTIILRPCLPGHVAYRDVELGGWFIHVLTKLIKEHARDKDVEQIMIEVSKEFDRMKRTKTDFYENSQRGREMTPCTNAYSFKKFFFLPKEEISLPSTQEQDEEAFDLINGNQKHQP